MDDLTKEELEQLLSVFRDQAIGILDDMTQDLLALEADDTDADAMSRLRRGAHTVKGDAACIGLEGITELAHRLEDLIDEIRSGGLRLEAAVVNLFLESLDEMRTAIARQEVEDIPPDILAKMLDAIALLGSARSPDDTKSGALTEVITGSAGAITLTSAELSEYQIKQVREAIRSGLQVYLIAADGHWSESDLQVIAGDESRLDLLSEARTEGNRYFLFATRLSPDGLMAWLQGKVPLEGISVSRVEAPAGNEVKVSPLFFTADRGQAAAKHSPLERRGTEYVRVETARIDALLNLAGEMVIARSVMNQVAPDLERAFPKNELVTRFSGASAHMGKLIAELQKGVLKMRMVTIDHVFRRFGRPMRELAAERGKQLDLEITGSDTELDRTLVDLIYEPLLHLLRNAVDHGLETAEEREAAGKPKVGKIKVRAYHEGNQVVVEVSDDGRGVDVEALKAKAVEAGQISAAQAKQISDEDAIELMFLQGISTAKEITRVSGRGVGASAVKSVVEELRGSISIKSGAGVGTTFILRMPLTLAIIKALLFTVGKQLIALPLLAVSEVALATPRAMVYLDTFESFRLRDRFISVVRPSVVLGFQSFEEVQSSNDEFFIIVVSVAGRRFGISADTLIGEQEVVIKPLDSQWLQNEALAGASVLGDGRVVLILDAGSVMRKAVKYERSRANGLLAL